MVEAGIAVVSVAVKFTTAPQLFSSLFTLIFAGTTIDGATPTTVTLNVVLEILLY